jgi:hypothetical protein
MADTLGFISTAAITWETRRGTTITYFLRSTNLHSTKEDAAVAALLAAKAWIDSHGGF